MRQIAAGLMFIVSVSVAGEASAHARLLATVPAKASMVATPSEIRLKFDEAVETRLSGVELSTKAGEKVATGALSEDPADKATLVVPVGAALETGTYRVHWHVVSDDMHKLQGDFTFDVKP
jgi:methionine-rich copper-binding protein CopC